MGASDELTGVSVLYLSFCGHMPCSYFLEDLHHDLPCKTKYSAFASWYTLGVNCAGNSASADYFKVLIWVVGFDYICGEGLLLLNPLGSELTLEMMKWSS